MISIVRFWNTVSQRAKIGTTGYDAPEEFLNKVEEVQTEAATMLSSFYDSNQNVKDLLAPFVVISPVEPSTSAGVVEYPDSYLKLVGITVEGSTSIPISVDQVPSIINHPVRKPDKTKKKFRHYQSDNKLHLLPAEQLNASVSYIRHPKKVKLTLVEVSTEDNDYLEPSTTPADIEDLEWPETAFNLLLYMFLEKLGIEMKEQLLVEYANIGIGREQTKNQSN